MKTSNVIVVFFDTRQTTQWKGLRPSLVGSSYVTLHLPIIVKYRYLGIRTTMATVIYCSDLKISNLNRVTSKVTFRCLILFEDLVSNSKFSSWKTVMFSASTELNLKIQTISLEVMV